MNYRTSILLVMLIAAADCTSNTAHDDWTTMDYDKIARENAKRDNDSAYVPAQSVTNCVDDDLYNCNKKTH